MGHLDDATIKEIANRVAAVLRPDAIYLFGSYAWGRPNADSDVDLYVVVPDQAEPGYRLARRAYHALRGINVPVDIVIRSRTESQRNRGVVASLDHEILARGVNLGG